MALAAEPVADSQWPEPAVWPEFAEAYKLDAAGFDRLKAEVLVDRLKVRWEPGSDLANPGRVPERLTVYASADFPGHWRARDWRPYRMVRSGTAWEANIPVDDVDVPILYFVTSDLTSAEPASAATEDQARGDDARKRSAMRLCWPRRLGLEGPTRVFWPFLEGFEEDLQSWQVLSSRQAGVSLGKSGLARTGRAALEIQIPEGRRSATVGTTRIRGWQVKQQQAVGFSLWLRTVEGEGLVRFTLLSQAFATNQVVAPCRREIPVTETWTRVELAFEEFRDAALAALDMVTLELVGQGPCRFLVDDLRLVGPWLER